MEYEKKREATKELFVVVVASDNDTHQSNPIEMQRNERERDRER